MLQKHQGVANVLASQYGLKLEMRRSDQMNDFSCFS